MWLGGAPALKEQVLYDAGINYVVAVGTSDPRQTVRDVVRDDVALEITWPAFQTMCSTVLLVND